MTQTKRQLIHLLVCQDVSVSVAIAKATKRDILFVVSARTICQNVGPVHASTAQADPGIQPHARNVRAVAWWCFQHRHRH